MKAIEYVNELPPKINANRRSKFSHYFEKLKQIPTGKWGKLPLANSKEANSFRQYAIKAWPTFEVSIREGNVAYVRKVLIDE